MDFISKSTPLRSEYLDLSTNKQQAFSYSSNWPVYGISIRTISISLNLSHNERLPTAKELYYYGKHLATNSLNMATVI